MAPLNKALLSVLPGPLDSGKDSKVLPTPRLVEAVNCYRAKDGEYRKRSGRKALGTGGIPSGGSLSAVWQLGTHKQTLVSLSKRGNPALHTLREVQTGETAGAEKWSIPAVGQTAPIQTQQRGPVTSTRIPIIGEEAAFAQPDVAVLPGTNLAMVVLEKAVDAGPIVEVCIDLATGNRLFTNTFAGGHPRVEVISGHVFVVYEDGVNLKIRDWTAAEMVTAPAIPALVQSQVFTAINVHRIETMVYGSVMYVAVRTNDAGTQGISVITYDGSTLATAVSLVTGTTNVDLALGWLRDSGSSTFAWLAYAGSVGGLKVAKINSTPAVVATDTIDTGADLTGASPNCRNITGHTRTSAAAGVYQVIYEVSNTATPWKAKLKYGVKDAAAVITASDWILSLCLRSKTWKWGSDFYVCVAFDSTVQPTYFVMRVPSDIETASPTVRGPAVKFHRWVGNGKTESGNGTKEGTAGSSANIGLTGVGLIGNDYVVAVPRQTVDLKKANVQTINVAIDVVQFTADSLSTGRPVEAADSMFVPAGQLFAFDGREYAELNFPVYPEQPTTALIGGAGGQTAGAKYQYVVVYRYVDQQGRIIRSTPSVPSTALAFAAGNAYQVTVPCLHVNGHEPYYNTDVMQIEIYRTLGNGAVYYLVGTLANDASVASKTFIDTAPDTGATGIDQSELLYTTGDVLETHSPPQFVAVCLHRNRLWGIDADFPTRLWPSREIEPGRLPEFNEALAIDTADDYGELTALASMDDKLAVFKRSAVYVVTGDGPDNLGRLPYSKPERVGVGVGTLVPRSVISYPLGVGFDASDSKGKYTLTRSLDLQAHPEVKDWASATLDAIHEAAESRIRFALANGDNLLFDYKWGEWFRWNGQTAAAMVLHVRAAGSAVAMVSPNSGSTVAREVSTIYTDEGLTYRMQLTTGWISLAQILGFQRISEVYVLGEKLVGGATSILKMDLAYDFVTTASETRELHPPSGTTPWAMKLKPARQKCMSLQVTLYDAASGGSSVNDDCRVSALGIWYGMKGRGRPPSANRMGPESIA